MRDPDEVMAYEARQQRLVEEIVRSLYSETANNKDHIATFGQIAQNLLDCLNDTPIDTSTQTGRLVGMNVNRPIIEFIGRDRFEKRYAEAKYLELKVLEKVMDAISAHITADYNRYQLAEQMKDEEERSRSWL